MTFSFRYIQTNDRVDYFLNYFAGKPLVIFAAASARFVRLNRGTETLVKQHKTQVNLRSFFAFAQMVSSFINFTFTIVKFFERRQFRCFFFAMEYRLIKIMYHSLLPREAVSYSPNFPRMHKLIGVNEWLRIT
jgi:hypothetical protein